MTKTNVEKREWRKRDQTIDLQDDVLRRIKREMGVTKFLPISSGKLVDLWWRPVELETVMGRTKTGDSPLNIHVQILVDTSPYWCNPCGDEISLAFRTDPREIALLCYLFARVNACISCISILDFQKWLIEMAKALSFNADKEEDLYCSKFACDLFEAIFKTTNAIPEMFKLYISKRTSTSIILPEECSHDYNMNSIGITTPNGFRYEYRSRLFIMNKRERESLDEDVEGVPASQDPLA